MHFPHPISTSQTGGIGQGHATRWSVTYSLPLGLRAYGVDGRNSMLLSIDTMTIGVVVNVLTLTVIILLFTTANPATFAVVLNSSPVIIRCVHLKG